MRQFKKGDYAYALEYYQKAFEIDSNAIAIKWKLAETNRAYKDYKKAAKYYKEVFELERNQIVPIQFALVCHDGKTMRKLQQVD